MGFRTRGRVVLVVLALATVLLGVSCSQEPEGLTVTLSPSYESSKTAEDITVSPAVTEAADVIRYKAARSDGTCSSASTSEWITVNRSGGSFQINSVSPGRWVFTVGAFTASGLQVYEGSTEVTVGTGSNTVIAVVMKRCRDTAKGSLLIDVQSYARRGVLQNRLSVKYRRAGDSAWTEKLVTPGDLQEDYSIIPWYEEITGLPGGRYEVSMNILRDSQAYGGKTFTVDVFAGRQSAVRGFLGGGEKEKHKDLEITLHDLIAIAETFDTTLPIVGFVDTLTGQDFTEEILEKTGKHILYNCNASGISEFMSFDSLGIRPVYMQNYTVQQKLAVKLLLVTRNCQISCTSQTAGWLGNNDSNIPQVRTVYINRNIDTLALYMAGNVTRLILGRDPGFTTIRYRGLSMLDNVTELYIPSNITTIEDAGVNIHPSSVLSTACAHSSGTFKSTELAVKSYRSISWNTQKPMTEL